MKHLLFSLCALFTFSAQINAQPQGNIWIGSRTTRTNADKVQSAPTYNALIHADSTKGWVIYTAPTGEVFPEHNVVLDRKALLENWTEFVSSAVSSFQVTDVCNPCSFRITANRRSATGKMRKIAGKWKIEADLATLGMPALDAASKD